MKSQAHTPPGLAKLACWAAGPLRRNGCTRQCSCRILNRRNYGRLLGLLIRLLLGRAFAGHRPLQPFDILPCRLRFIAVNQFALDNVASQYRPEIIDFHFYARTKTPNFSAQIAQHIVRKQQGRDCELVRQFLLME